MIYRYRFSNCWSFDKETEVSFLLNRHTPEINSTFTTPRGTRLSKLMAVNGANGAGKTNALLPLSFLSWFIADSFSGDRHAHLAINNHFFSGKADSELEVEFEHDGAVYRYKLIINTVQVKHESLHRKTDRAFSYLFHRDMTEPGEYKIKQKNFGLPQTQAQWVRHNASLISTAAQYGVPLALEITKYFERINVNTNLVSPKAAVLDSADFFHQYPQFQTEMSDFMRQVDLGLAGVEITVVHNAKEDGSSEIWPLGIHRKGRKEIRLPFLGESQGTQTMFVLLRHILPVLEEGGMLILDELDEGLHPDMVMAVLDLFTDTDSNPHNAQVIFTSYTPDVMDTLLKEQMLLVEKYQNESEAWRLDDIQGIRRDDNYYGKYRAGAYGGIPNI